MMVIASLTNIINIEWAPFYLDNVRFGLIFYMLGALLKKTNLLTKLFNNWWLIIILFIIFAVSTYFNPEMVLMYKNQYGNYILFYLGSLSGIMFTILISNVISTKTKTLNNIFTYFGSNTLWFYIMQFYVLDAVDTIFWHLPISKYLGSACTFIFTMLIIIPVDKFVKKYVQKYI